MVRRPLTNAAFPPVLVDTEHGYVAPVPGFSVRALLADYTAYGDVRTAVGECLSEH